MAWVAEQGCHSQVLAAGNVIYRPFQSKSLNLSLFLYCYVQNLHHQRLLLKPVSEIRNTNPLFDVARSREPVLERSVVPLWCHKDRWHLVRLLARWQRVFAFHRKLMRVKNASLFFCCVIIFLPPCLPQLKLPTSSSTQCGLSAATTPPPLSAMSSWCRRRSRRNVSVVKVKTK